MWRMRCSEGQLGCGRRFTRKRAPHEYARAVRCPSCRSIHVHSVEKAARAQTKRRKARGLICRCSNYPFPHVRATLRFCREHPQILADYTETDWRGYRAVLETPRGAHV